MGRSQAGASLIPAASSTGQPHLAHQAREGRGAAFRPASPNEELVGLPGSRHRLATPALVLDLDAFEANLQHMAALAQRAGLGLRPHAKTHKCSEIARRQIAAGASGICCATVAEAVTMARAGLQGILVTSPPAGDWKIRQLLEAAAEAGGIMTSVDHEANVREISAAAVAAGATVDVLVDIDPGMNRTGVMDDGSVFSLASVARQLPGIRYRGLQCYDGGLQHVADYAERRDRIETLGRRISRLRRELTSAGLAPEIVSGGGTGSADLESVGTFTELQVGSYIFMDVDYCRVLGEDSRPLPYQPSLFVASTVVNSHRSKQSTIDAGTKAMTRGWGVPTVVTPMPGGLRYEFSGDEHGRLIYAESQNESLEPGDKVELLTPHCDPTVDLYAFYHCVRGDTLVDIWTIDARSHR